MKTVTEHHSNRYIAPTKTAEKAFNAGVKWLAEHGVSLLGTRVLEIAGRKSGEIRTTVVNVLELGGETFVVAPRGHTHWVKNLRAAGTGIVRIGRKRNPFTAIELADEDKLPVLREYLRRWGWEIGQFFEGLDKNATDEQLREIAPGFPVFRIHVD